MKSTSVLLRARVPEQRYRNAERILDRLGMNPGDAVNLLMAQIELRQGLPFDVSLGGEGLISSDQQAQAWTEALGEY
jgi:addiction module RelB/DinJ family antitoxin